MGDLEDIVDDADYVASEHDRLVSAISKLDKTQHINEPTRNEPTNLNSEFNLIKRSKKLDLSNIVKVLGDTAHNVQIGKKLKKSQDVSIILPKPLERPQVERIKRSTGYEETKKKVGRWDPVVARSRTVDFVSFPIKSVSTKLQPTEEFISKFELKSALEKELEEVDPPAMVEVEDEEEKLYPMTYQEMMEQRQHLAKMRAQQSYKAAKAKRQSKIKSKKYHRILKKEKLKAQLKEFEDLQKKDPEEALKKLEALEKARALERHTLRHKNTGKWAKNKLVRAKYDKDVRQELAEQLAVSRALTQKTQSNESSDDEPETNEAISDIALSQDPMNPWMLKRSDKSNVDEEFDFEYKKYVQGRMYKTKDESESDEDNENNESNSLEQVKDGVKKINKVDKDFEEDDITENAIAKIEEKSAVQTEITNNMKSKKGKRSNTEIHIVPASDIVNNGQPHAKKTKKSLQKTSKQVTNLVATSNWIVESVIDNDQCEAPTKSSKDILTAFDSLEDDITGKVEKKLQKLRKNIQKLETTKPKVENRNEKKEFDNLEYLKMKNQKVKAIIDEELIETASKNMEDSKDLSKPLSDVLKPAQVTTSRQNADSNIDPSRFIQVKPKYLNTALSGGDNDYDLLDDDEQVVPKVNIEEVFEEDDVVASFRQEKEDDVNKDKPEDIDLSLPGWGAWGGKGVKPCKRKKNRFILKAPPQMTRRDENKGDIIIKEYKDPKLQVHKVSDIPFPFTSVKDYEASIRAPLGNTFIPENAHKKLIKPSVITKAGTIIDPMDEDELLEKRNRNFKNESVLKLLGQK